MRFSKFEQRSDFVWPTLQLEHSRQINAHVFKYTFILRNSCKISFIISKRVFIYFGIRLILQACASFPIFNLNSPWFTHHPPTEIRTLFELRKVHKLMDPHLYNLPFCLSTPWVTRRYHSLFMGNPKTWHGINPKNYSTWTYVQRALKEYLNRYSKYGSFRVKGIVSGPHLLYQVIYVILQTSEAARSEPFAGKTEKCSLFGSLYSTCTSTLYSSSSSVERLLRVAGMYVQDTVIWVSSTLTSSRATLGKAEKVGLTLANGRSQKVVSTNCTIPPLAVL